MSNNQTTQYQANQASSLNLDRQMCILRYSPCGRYVAAGGYDGTVRRWDSSREELTSLPNLSGHHGWVQALTFHPDRRRLFTADSWGEIRIWPYAQREPRPLQVIPSAHDGWIRDLAISTNGQWFATCGMDQKVRLWNMSGERIHEFSGHNEDVFCVAFHPNNRFLVSGDLKGNVYQWDLTTRRRTRTFNCQNLYTLSRLQDVGGVRRLVFNPEGTMLACAGSQVTRGANVQGTPTILLFDWESGERRHTLTVGRNGDGYVYDFAFHESGFVMAVTSGNPGTGKFFFYRPGEERPFFLHTRMANCHSLAVHPEGNRLLVAATNTGSNGNGRRLRNGEYPGNYSPLYLWNITTS